MPQNWRAIRMKRKIGAKLHEFYLNPSEKEQQKKRFLSRLQKRGIKAKRTGDNVVEFKPKGQ